MRVTLKLPCGLGRFDLKKIPTPTPYIPYYIIR